MAKARAIAISITRKQPEREKIVAERINGYAAMLGCIAAIGAWATTGQIIPGVF